MARGYLSFEGISKRFDRLEVVAATFDIDIDRGQFVVFLGPSGCGKSTLMRMIGGLDRPTSGVIRLDGKVLGKPDERRGMVFQSYSSFPWLTVEQNIAFGMRYRAELSKADRQARTAHYMALVGLSDFANAYPARISGGMRQRVAIARTLAAGPDVLLMDEPFGALDAQRREQLQVELRRIQNDDSKTVVFVTHDVEEAVFLADRIIVFSQRPARVMMDIDVAAELGKERSLELRDSEAFFHLKTGLLRRVRATMSSTG